MIATAVLFVGIELALIIAFALFVSRVDIASSSSSVLGDMSTAAGRLPDRPQGVQEEDLPRFVFRSPAPSLNPA